MPVTAMETQEEPEMPKSAEIPPQGELEPANTPHSDESDSDESEGEEEAAEEKKLGRKRTIKLVEVNFYNYFSFS